jgi:hypothetical protein
MEDENVSQYMSEHHGAEVSKLCMLILNSPKLRVSRLLKFGLDNDTLVVLLKSYMGEMKIEAKQTFDYYDEEVRLRHHPDNAREDTPVKADSAILFGVSTGTITSRVNYLESNKWVYEPIDPIKLVPSFADSLIML